MNFRRLKFPNRNGQTLAARLDLPLDGAPHAYAVFAHCFTCSKNLTAIGNINTALTRNGIAVLRFDFTGLGESEGDFADTNFTTNVEDLVDAAQFLAEHYKAPKILIGHSLGGAAVLQASARIDASEAVAVIGAPASTDHVLKHLTGAREQIEKRGEAEVQLDGRPFRIKKEFIDDLEADHMSVSIRTLKRPLLILHSPIDNIVGIENAATIFRAARHPKSFISLDRADHLLSDKADSEYVGAMIAAWSLKYLPPPGPDASREAAADNRVLTRTGKTGFRTEILANGHGLLADEPLSVGGTDTGPTPYDYVVAGLGACTSMTLRMYADRKKWPLDAIDVRLAHRKIHADDCKDCENEPRYLDEIEREITLEGDLDGDQRKRLLQIADRCPVHRTLEGEIRIRTKLAE